MNTPQVIETIAVLTLSETGEILAARDACMAVFGRDVGALIGVNVRVLLKGGLDNDVGRLLHGHRTGKNPTEAAPLHVVALKKDSTEFMASVATLKWNSDTAVTKKSDAARLTWTIAFRDLSTRGEAAGQPSPRPHEKGDSDVEQTPESKQDVPAANRAEKSSAGPRKEEVDLNDNVFSEENVIAESRRHVEELEVQLRKAVEEFEAFKAETACRSEDQKRLESELRAQLDAAKESAGYAQAALKEEVDRKEKLEERLQTLSSNLKLEQAERSKRFEQELISLRQERDELNCRLAAEQQSATESTERAEGLEKRLSRNATDFERAKAELERQNAERGRVESAWREQLDTAFIAKKQLEGAWAGEVERSKRFEEELSKLRQEHDELIGKLTTEQKAASESRQRAKEVEGRLGRNAADSERARVEIEKETVERERVESEWREQLDEAKVRKVKAELALAEATRTNKRLEQELARLRPEHGELSERFLAEQKAATESARRADALQRTVNQGLVDLERAQGAKEKLEKAHAEAAERGLRMEASLATLQQKHEGLAARLAAQQAAAEKYKGRTQELEDLIEQRSAEVESLLAEREHQTGSRDRFESEWKKQLDEVKAQKKELEAAWTGAVDRNMHFEELLSGLRKERDDLTRKLKAEKQAVAQAKQQFDGLQTRLDQSTAEATRVKAELENRGIEQARAEAEWGKRIETATSLTKKLEGAWAESVERNRRLESELEKLHRERDQSNAKSVAERKAGAEAGKQTAAAPNKPVRSIAEREPGNSTQEKPVKSGRKGAELNEKNHLPLGNAPVEKANGNHAPERSNLADGDLSDPPKPSVGLYNLKP